MKPALVLPILIALLTSTCRGFLAGAFPTESFTPSPSFTFSPSPSLTASPSLTFTASPSPTATASLTPSLTPPPSLTLPAPQTPQKVYPSCEPVEVTFNPYPLPVVTPSPTIIPSLRSLAGARGLWIGAAADGGYLLESRYAELLRSQFNLLASENAMKWERLHPEPEVYDFREADSLVAFAELNNMAVYGHALVWGLQLPNWILEGRYSRSQWVRILCTHVKTVAHHFRGKMLAWDVVNEAMANEGMLYDNLWLEKIGPEYIAMAFQWAHEADPQAILVYNDHSAEGLNPKSQAIYTLVEDLLKMGIPIQAVGMQMHVHLKNAPSKSELAANMQRLANLGLQVHITEMDVRIQYGKETLAEKLAMQADIYRDVLAVCLAQSNCRIFTTWGASDLHSWVPGITGRPDAPLLFDEAGQAKPAYYAVVEELSRP